MLLNLKILDVVCDAPERKQNNTQRILFTQSVIRDSLTNKITLNLTIPSLSGCEFRHTKYRAVYHQKTVLQWVLNNFLKILP